MWSQTHYLLQVSLCAVCGASSTTSFLWSHCAVWRARLSPCLLTESLCCQREPDSATFLAESLSCVWSEPGSVASYSRCCTVYSDWCDCVYRVVERLSSSAEPLGCTVLQCTVYILWRSRGAVGGGVRSTCSGASGERVYSDIVKRSASEQTHMSHCIWYSKQM